jgi:hypothetical protein
MGYALSLFGRSQDRLSHVLVSSDFEANPDFYYPTKDGSIIYDKRHNNRPLDPAQADVILADIPFLRINNNEAQNTMSGFSFKETIDATQELLQPVSLVIDFNKQLILANNHLLKLQDQQFAFYCWVLQCQQKGKPVRTPANNDEQFVYFKDFIKIYKEVKGEMGSYEKTDDSFDDGMKSKYIQETVSKIKREVEKQLGIVSASFIIKSSGRPATYTVAVKAENITYDDIKR